MNMILYTDQDHELSTFVDLSPAGCEGMTLEQAIACLSRCTRVNTFPICTLCMFRGYFVYCSAITHEEGIYVIQ